MSGALRKGYQATTNLNGGSYGTPTWASLALQQDTSVPDSMDEAEATARGTNGVKCSEPTLQNVGIEFTMLKDTGNAQYLALRTAYLARAALDILCCSGDPAVSGNTYVRADFKIFEFSNGEPLGGLQTVNVKMKPCYPTNPPTQGITPLS